MAEDLISVANVARRCGKRKQTVFKVLKRLGIEPEKQRTSERHGQISSYITQTEFEVVSMELSSVQELASAPPDMIPMEIGVFYLVQLEPVHDPGRCKAGFASNMNERLRAHHCAAPFAKVIKTWPCRSLWEKTVIDCVCDGCERLHTEVFRTDSIAQVVEKCDEFFSLMPRLVDDGKSE